MYEKRGEYGNKMPNEHTPLIQSVPVEERRQRYPNSRVRRTCTIALTSGLFIVAIVFIGLAIAGKAVFPIDDGNKSPDHAGQYPHTAWPESEGITYEELKKTLLDTPDAKKAREWSQYYTSGPHLAGKNISQAETDGRGTNGLSSACTTPVLVSYDVYINYPLDHRLALLRDGKVDFEATLEEDVLEEDPTTNLTDRVPTFHGYSASGDVTGSFVFANYGTYQDYEDLVNAGIDLTGKIVLVKYGGVFRGLKVKRASDLGAIGVVIYDDPGEDGDITEEKGFKPYPEGPARNPSSVQRGSVEYLSVAPGDPTTIGYPSKPGVPRQSTEGKIPDIPSLPISYEEALPLLKALNGHGPNATSFPKSWHNGGLGYKGVHYNIGPTPDSITINLMNKQEYVTTPLWNAIGIINGTVDDEVIVIGNHRDAWIAGGAGDPNSGSAALNEVIRSFGVALASGWKPHRTIVFASWDGEEYGLIGSTEWVEEYLPWLSKSTIAYINVDVGARGPHFTSAASPVLNKAIYEVTSQVQSPNQTVAGQTVRDTWSGHISTMGSGSDFTAFQDFAGIPSIDVGFGAGKNDPVYHYHSNYDSFHWMNKYGDPGFQYHMTMAKILALLAAKLIEEPVVQFNATDYAVGLGNYLSSLEKSVSTSSLSKAPLKKLEKAIHSFLDAAISFDAEATDLQSQLHSSASMSAERKNKLYYKIRALNTKYKLLERQFLYQPGLDSRAWFKHVVFAPGLWTGYAGATYPGLVEAYDDKDEMAVEKWTGIIVGTVESARKLLEE